MITDQTTELPIIRNESSTFNTHTGVYGGTTQLTKYWSEPDPTELLNKLTCTTTHIVTDTGELTVPRRVTQVYIVDPNGSVPLDKALLYKGQEQFTDLTDQELFFEIDIKGILDKYNEERVKIVDKDYKGTEVQYLEKARVRDLIMTVVTIASFGVDEK